MADEKSVLNKGKGTALKQQKKRECLKCAITKSKVFLLRGKEQWIHERVDKASNETINETYAGYMQCELNEKGE